MFRIPTLSDARAVHPSRAASSDRIHFATGQGQRCLPFREVLSRGGFLTQVNTFERKKWFDRSQYEGYANRLTLVQNLPAFTPSIQTRANSPAGVVEVG